jgi:hypothetical protein
LTREQKTAFEKIRFLSSSETLASAVGPKIKKKRNEQLKDELGNALAAWSCGIVSA